MSEPMYAIHKPDRLRVLMERTGTGEEITIRELAEAAGVSHGTIGALMTGTQRMVPERKARAIVDAIGVDLLVLFVPMERAGRAFVERQVSA